MYDHNKQKQVLTDMLRLFTFFNYDIHAELSDLYRNSTRS